MGIKLGNFNIERDTLNWVLQEKRVPKANHHMTKTTAAKFVDVGYYGKIEHLINALLNRELLRSDINTLQDIKTLLFQIENTLKSDVYKAIELNTPQIWTTEDSI